MTCKLTQVTLHFLRSGIKIRPYDLSTQSERNQFNHAKAEISRKAGELLASRGLAAEPVHVIFGETVQDRYIFPEDGVSLGGDRANIELYDSLKVLDRGVASANFDDSSLREIIEFIIDERDDPEGVITGIVHPDEETQGSETLSADAFLDKNTPLPDFKIKQINFDYREFLAKAALGKVGIQLPSGGLHIKEESPLSALLRTQDLFQIDSWVDADGRFHYESRSVVDTETFLISADLRRYALTEYNVIVSSGKVSRVHYTSSLKYKIIDASFEVDDLLFPIKYLYKESGARTVSPNGVSAHGVASIDIPNGHSISPDPPKNIHGPQALEAAATRRLLAEHLDNKSGNIVINGVASEDKARLTNMHVGDYVFVFDDLPEKCVRDVDGGFFLITSVQHKINSREGWKIIAEVGSIPLGAIETDSWIYDESENEKYDTLELYYNDNGSEERWKLFGENQFIGE
ncbi:hypothetical protein [Halapricum desulfuricans]|uniref:Uncharacterized protein n=1 Tax=Halapricum desulfuricans TaxID=2841257 RepID=A0A897N2F6_9EURY|nr:hypothetical protein [Halapricum desulfuricans]QSG06408.1 hypothetical protein HSR121_2076 [Halapricum desulfuricans]